MTFKVREAPSVFSMLPIKDAPVKSRPRAAQEVLVSPWIFWAVYTIWLESMAEAIRLPSEVMVRKILSISFSYLSRFFAANTSRWLSSRGGLKVSSSKTCTSPKPAFERRSSTSSTG